MLRTIPGGTNWPFLDFPTSPGFVSTCIFDLQSVLNIAFSAA
jgi:hypothetical protein